MVVDMPAILQRRATTSSGVSAVRAGVRRTHRAVLAPARLVIEAALIIGQRLASLQMKQQVNEAHLGAGFLHIGGGGSHGGLVGTATGEELAEFGLALQQPGALGLG